MTNCPCWRCLWGNFGTAVTPDSRGYCTLYFKMMNAYDTCPEWVDERKFKGKRKK